MADVERGNLLGFIDKRRTQISTTAVVGTPANYTSVGALRTRLAAIDGTYFSAARLNSMTFNDMIYALRLADDLAGV